jgi:hypothetical protein
MRVLFGCLAVLLGVVSITLAARYGWKTADTVVDGFISAIVFGLVALCAFLFDAAGVRLWFMGHRLGSVVIGLIAASALVVTFTNSLGTIASRADMTLAERTKLADARQDDRRELSGWRGPLPNSMRFSQPTRKPSGQPNGQLIPQRATVRPNARSAGQIAGDVSSTSMPQRRAWQALRPPSRQPIGQSNSKPTFGLRAPA